MEKVLRTIKLLEMIPQRGKVTVAALRERLEQARFPVSQRTVERDLKALSRVFPLRSDEPHRPAGWQWASADRVTLPGLDPVTALSIVLTEQYLARLLPPGARSHLAGEAERARAVLAEAERGGLGRWEDKVRVVHRGPALLPAPVDEQLAASIYQALLEGKRLACRYAPRGQAAKCYEMNPLGLIVRDSVTYVVVTLWDYDDPSHLPLHRFREVRLLDKPVSVPAGFTLDGYLRRGEFSFPVEQGRPIRLRALFDHDTALHLAETPLSDDQRWIERRDGRVLIEARVHNTMELRWWLLGFGKLVEVHGPKRLREEMATTVRRMARMYSARRGRRGRAVAGR